MTLLGGRYRLGELRRQGGQGLLYQGMDEQDGVPVAIKRIFLRNTGWPTDEQDQVRHRFRKEVRALRDLPPSPHVVRFRDAFQDHRELHLVTSWLDGEPLDDVLGARPRPRLEEVTRWTRGLCAALDHCHRAGIVHRDVKPANVMIVDSRAVLVDFGIVRITGATATMPGNVAGTFAYLAPERWRGEPGDARTDLYSLGCVLYELLTGEPPFGRSAAIPEMFSARHLEDVPPPPGERVPGVPAALDLLTCDLLAKEPRDRPRSAAEVLARLSGVPAPTLVLADQEVQVAEERFGPADPRALKARAERAERIGGAGDVTGAIREYDRILELCEREFGRFDDLSYGFRQARNRWLLGLS